MNQQFESEIMDFYFGERRDSLETIAARHGAALETAQDLLERIERLGRRFKTMPQHQASQLALNKVLAYAGEAAGQRASVWWRWVISPLSAGAVAVAVLVTGILMWQGSQQVTGVRVAQTQIITPSVATPPHTDSSYHQVITRLLKTPLDRDDYEPLGQKGQFLVGGVSTVSLGGASHSTDTLIQDDVMDRIERNIAGSDEIKTLFFRARKLEKLGRYQDALHDYLVIAQNTQNFDHEQSVHLSIANCYEKLGDRQTALMVLESYRQSFGRNDELDFWIDHLKSETL